MKASSSIIFFNILENALLEFTASLLCPQQAKAWLGGVARCEEIGVSRIWILFAETVPMELGSLSLGGTSGSSGGAILMGFLR